MSEENRTPTTQFVEVGDVNHSVELASEGKDNFQSQLLDWRMYLSEIDTKINGIVQNLTIQLEALLQTVEEFIEWNLNRSTEGTAAFEQSISSVQRSDMMTGSTRHTCLDMATENGTNPFKERYIQHRYETVSSVTSTPYQRLHRMVPDDASNVGSDNHKNHVMAAIKDMPQLFHTTQAKTKLHEPKCRSSKARKRSTMNFNIYL